jgi:hypothetical protein
MKTDRRITLALVAIIGLSIGWLLPTETRSVSNANQPQDASYRFSANENYTALNSSLDELQVLVAKLQPPPTKAPEFETVLEKCCPVPEVVKTLDSPSSQSRQTLDKCICPNCPRCDEPSPAPVAEVAKTLERTPAKPPISSKTGYKPGLVASSTTPANYTPRWTHPSTIEDHMVSTHGVSTVGKTKAQLYAEHDALHDAERSSRSRQTVAVSSVVRSSSSSCPGGVCPVPSRTTRTAAPVRMFRLFRR